MADNVSLNPGVGGDTIAADEIGGIKYQRVKLTLGADGANDGDISSSNPIPANIIAALPAGANIIGALVANQSVNLTQIGGVALAFGQAVSASSIPVVIASNQSTLNVQLQTGANIIGALVANQSVNMTQINGNAVVTVASGVQKVGIADSSGNNITIGQKTMANSFPVAIASDQSTIPVQLQTGANVIGSLIANQSVNISQIGGITPAMKAASTAAVAADVSLVVALSPNSPVPTGSNTIGSIASITTAVVPGTGATNLGKACDAPHTSGDVGVMALAVRNDNPAAATTNNNNDYAQISVDQAGVTWVRKRQITTYSAGYRLADATAGRLGLSFAFTANVNKQLATIYHTGASTKTVKIRKISLWLSVGALAVFNFEIRALSSTTAPATGNPAITPGVFVPGSAAAEATCLALPTTAGSLVAANSPLGLITEWNSASANNTNDPDRQGQELVLYEYKDGMEMQPLTMRAGNAEGYAVNGRASSGVTLIFHVTIIFTEE